jgi:hypothetical protein
MKIALITIVMVCLVVAGCGEDPELQAAKEEASRWRMLAIVGTLGAIFIGMAMGSRSKP